MCDSWPWYYYTQDATTANQTRPSLLSDILLLCKKHCQKQINKTKKSVDIYLCFFLRKLSFQVFKYHIYTYEHIILYIKKQEQRKWFFRSVTMGHTQAHVYILYISTTHGWPLLPVLLQEFSYFQGGGWTDCKKSPTPRSVPCWPPWGQQLSWYSPPYFWHQLTR